MFYRKNIKSKEHIQFQVVKFQKFSQEIFISAFHPLK